MRKVGGSPGTKNPARWPGLLEGLGLRVAVGDRRGARHHQDAASNLLDFRLGVHGQNLLERGKKFLLEILISILAGILLAELLP